jgi:hypothetical protein
MGNQYLFVVMKSKSSLNFDRRNPMSRTPRDMGEIRRKYGKYGTRRNVPQFLILGASDASSIRRRIQPYFPALSHHRATCSPSPTLAVPCATLQMWMISTNLNRSLPTGNQANSTVQLARAPEIWTNPLV